MSRSRPQEIPDNSSPASSGRQGQGDQAARSTTQAGSDQSHARHSGEQSTRDIKRRDLAARDGSSSPFRRSVESRRSSAAGEQSGAASSERSVETLPQYRHGEILMHPERPGIQYRMLHELGRGANGKVHLAVIDEHTVVAIKMSPSPLLLKEYKLMKRVEEHTRELYREEELKRSWTVPRPFDFFEKQGTYYIVMENIQGVAISESLQPYVKQGPDSFVIEPVRGRLLEEVLDWGIQLCNQLHVFHTLRPPIIFRDLWPANIMLWKGNVRLVDAGAAREQTSEADELLLSQFGETAGRYKAPEVVAREHPLTPQTDIYSLGTVLCVLLLGYETPSHTPLPDLGELRQRQPNLSESLFTLLDRMGRNNLSERPQNMLEVKAHLLEVQREHFAAHPQLGEAWQRYRDVQQRRNEAQDRYEVLRLSPDPGLEAFRTRGRQLDEANYRMDEALAQLRAIRERSDLL